MGIFDSLTPKRSDLIGKWMSFVPKKYSRNRFYATCDWVSKIIYSAETFEPDIVISYEGLKGKLVKCEDGVEIVETS